VLQSFVHAGTSNLPGIVDAESFDEHPARGGIDRLEHASDLPAQR